MKLQTSSRFQSNERDISSLGIKINSNKAPDMAATPESDLRKKFWEQICGDTTWISRKVKPNLVLQNCALDPIGEVMRLFRTKDTADILLAYEWIVTLVFWHQQMVGDVRFYLKYALELPTLSKMFNYREVDRALSNELYRWNAYVIPNSPKG